MSEKEELLLEPLQAKNDQTDEESDFLVFDVNDNSVKREHTCLLNAYIYNLIN